MGKLLQKAKNAIEKDAKKVEDSVKHAASSAASVVKSAGTKIEDEVKTAETAVSKDAKAVIGGIKDDIQTVATKISDTARSDAGKIVSGAKQFAQELPTKLSAAGNYLEDAVISAADTIGKAEDAILPSPTSIITETGLIVAAIVAVAIVAFKVV